MPQSLTTTKNFVFVKLWNKFPKYQPTIWILVPKTDDSFIYLQYAKFIISNFTCKYLIPFHSFVTSVHSFIHLSIHSFARSFVHIFTLLHSSSLYLLSFPFHLSHFTSKLHSVISPLLNSPQFTLPRPPSVHTHFTSHHLITTYCSSIYMYIITFCAV